MTTLQGGGRYRNQTRWQRLWARIRRAPGGTAVKNVKSIRNMGQGNEGGVTLVELTLQTKRGRTRRVRLALKSFFHNDDRPLPAGEMGWRSPRLQFKIVEQLIRLNKEKKLGLRLPGTVRIIDSRDTSYFQRYELLTTPVLGGNTPECRYRPKQGISSRPRPANTDRGKQWI